MNAFAHPIAMIKLYFIQKHKTQLVTYFLITFSFSVVFDGFSVTYPLYLHRFNQAGLTVTESGEAI
jgi:hypothetical protein